MLAGGLSRSRFTFGLKYYVKRNDVLYQRKVLGLRIQQQ